MSGKQSGRMGRGVESSASARSRARARSARGAAWAVILAAAWLFGNGALEAHPGVGIVMDRQGNVFYTDLAQVWKIASDGSRSIAVKNVHTHELCLDADGNLYGEHLWYEGEKIDKWGHRIWRLGADGKLVDVVPAREGFRKNYSFVRDAAGNMYWSEGDGPVEIRRRAPDGVITTQGKCASCRGGGWMTATPDGTVLFLDQGGLRRMGPDGASSLVAKHLESRSLTQLQVGDRHFLMGVWTDRAGSAYVAVYGARQVKRIDSEGHVEVVATSPPPWSPTGGLVAPNGDLWLLEYSLNNEARVRRIRKDGSETIF